MPTITIDNKEFDTYHLSNEAKSQLASVQLTDQEIQRLKLQLAMAQNDYAKALSSALPVECDTIKCN